MKTNSKKWLKRLGIFLGTLILIVVGYVVYVFSSYYRLEDKQKLTITGKSTEKAKTKKSYRITSGNIGFGAYSDDYSFFMDGGKESRARSKDAVIENVSSYAEAVASFPYAIFSAIVPAFSQVSCRTIPKLARKLSLVIF